MQPIMCVERGWDLVIHWHNQCPSTHTYVVEGLKDGTLCAPFALGTDEQTQGIGSRGNEWVGLKGNLFFSWCVEEKQLPCDLPLASISIYFSALMKAVLEAQGSKVWLKWPNDFYIDDTKIGGVITTKVGSSIIGSIGLNLTFAPDGFGILDIKMEPQTLASYFITEMEKKSLWKDVFSKYKLEFYKNRNATFHMGSQVVSLHDAVLCDDGSIELENKKVYSLR